MEDKYQKFAREWRSIGLSSRVKWRGAYKHEDIAPTILRRMIERFGEPVVEIIEETYYQAGLQDGQKLMESINIAADDASSCLNLIETICLTTGVETETLEKGENKAVVQVKGCPYTAILQSVDYPHTTSACEGYTRGLIHAVNKNAQISISRMHCKGGAHCEFTVTIEA